MILVKRFFAFNELRNYSYLLINQLTKDAWVIDPYNAHQIEQVIKKDKLNLVGILNTHQHHDHIKGNAYLIQSFQAKTLTFSHSQVFSELNRIDLNTTVGHSYLKVFSAPGHTMDHVIFLLIDESRPRALFSGDTLFNAGVGNCKGGGDVDALYDSIQEIKKFPQSLILYPGHDYRDRNLKFASWLLEREDLKNFHQSEDSTLKEELITNPFFLTYSHELRQKMISLNHPQESYSTDRELFKLLRRLRDDW